MAKKCSRSLKHYLVSQQNTAQIVPGSNDKKKIFINCENTFGSFRFAKKYTGIVFEPNATLARCFTSVDSIDNNTTEGSDNIISLCL